MESERKSILNQVRDVVSRNIQLENSFSQNISAIQPVSQRDSNTFNSERVQSIADDFNSSSISLHNLELQVEANNLRRQLEKVKAQQCKKCASHLVKIKQEQEQNVQIRQMLQRQDTENQALLAQLKKAKDELDNLKQELLSLNKGSQQISQSIRNTDDYMALEKFSLARTDLYERQIINLRKELFQFRKVNQCQSPVRARHLIESKKNKLRELCQKVHTNLEGFKCSIRSSRNPNESIEGILENVREVLQMIK